MNLRSTAPVIQLILNTALNNATEFLDKEDQSLILERIESGMASASFGTEVIVDLEISVFISMMKYLNVTLDRIVENINAHTIILMLERTIF